MGILGSFLCADLILPKTKLETEMKTTQPNTARWQAPFGKLLRKLAPPLDKIELLGAG